MERRRRNLHAAGPLERHRRGIHSRRADERGRAARAYALLNMAMHDAAWVAGASVLYFNPRPVQLDPSIKTVIGLPNFPA